MPISGQLRAVDSKVLGIDLAKTPLHGSALERYVFVSVDAGHGHAEGTLEFIEREAGVVVRESAGDPALRDPEHWTALAAARRSLDVLVVSAGSISAGETTEALAQRSSEALESIGTAIEALARSGGRVFLTFDIPAAP